MSLNFDQYDFEICYKMNRESRDVKFRGSYAVSFPGADPGFPVGGVPTLIGGDANC